MLIFNMGNEIACLRCNGTLDEKIFGKVLGARGAPTRGELELLVALQGLYNVIPHRLVEVLKQASGCSVVAFSQHTKPSFR